MSRSKRAPVWTQGYGRPSRRHSKRAASRAVRLEDEVADGRAYRKLFNPWDIVDWKSYDRSPSKPWKIRRK